VSRRLLVRGIRLLRRLDARAHEKPIHSLSYAHSRSGYLMSPGKARRL
jgi:hypothetical protein